MTVDAEILARLEELERRAGVAPGTTGVDASGFPTHVVAGELIESAWGNAVVDAAINTRPHFIVGQNLGGQQIAAGQWGQSYPVTLAGARPGLYLATFTGQITMIVGTNCYGNLVLGGASTGDKVIAQAALGAAATIGACLQLVLQHGGGDLTSYFRFGFGSNTTGLEPPAQISIVRLGN